MINAYLTLNPDGTVAIVSAAAELGQGSLSSLPMLIAEELELEIGQVLIEQAPLNPAAFNNRLFGYQTTVGTSAVRWAYEPLRQLGANTRELLRNAAAEIWNVPAAETVAAGGRVTHPGSGRSLSYFELGETASRLEIPSGVPPQTPQRMADSGHLFPALGCGGEHVLEDVSGSARRERRRQQSVSGRRLRPQGQSHAAPGKPR